jgi:galactoside O-acetyltransferase
MWNYSICIYIIKKDLLIIGKVFENQYWLKVKNMVISFYSEEELKMLGLKSYGKDVLISRKVSIYGAENIEVGHNVRIDDFCILSGNIKLGNYVHIAAAALLFGAKIGIEVKDFTGIGSRCAFYAQSEDFSDGKLTYPMLEEKYLKRVEGKILMEKYAQVGTGCTVFPGVTIGEGSAVIAMSMVTKNLGEWRICGGIPCRELKERDKGKILNCERELLGKSI